MDFKTVIKHQYRKILLLAMLIIVGFSLYKSYSSFFDKVNKMWDLRVSYDFANIVALAEQKLDKAKFDVEFNCENFNLDDKPVETEECKEAKEELKKAKEEYKKVIAKKDKLFQTEKQVKTYYDAVIKSAQQTPLPFAMLVLTLVSFLALLGFFINEFLPKRRKR